jgi:drug/metabolite transporter superfamily protein YnfA
MIDPLWLKALLKTLVLPPTGPLLVAVFGLVLLRRFPRVGRAFAAAGVIVTLALSIPIVAEFLAGFVDTSRPFDLEATALQRPL